MKEVKESVNDRKVTTGVDYLNETMQGYLKMIALVSASRSYFDFLKEEFTDTNSVWDSWGGNKAIIPETRTLGIKITVLPEKGTSILQPLDVGFMRQYEQFVNRLTDQSHFDGILEEMTSREDIINIQSLVWNQFSWPAYTDMLIWCWHMLEITLSNQYYYYSLSINEQYY